MLETDTLESLKQDIDYDRLIAQALPALRRYISRPELENARLRQDLLELRQSSARRQRAETARETRAGATPVQLPAIRHPDDVMVLTVTARGLTRRTPLNDYSAQRRGGVGVFDIQTTRDDLVALLAVAPGKEA